MTQRHILSTSGSPIRRSLEATDQTQYYYPSVPSAPSIQRPLAVHIHHGKHPSGHQKMEEMRVHSSISAASGSSAISYHKRQTPSPTSQWPSPTLERTLVNGDDLQQNQYSKWDRPESSSTSHGHKRSENRGTGSPAQAYTKERRQVHDEPDDDDDDDDDHALWVLFWLAALDPIHSLASCLFTLIVTLGLLLASPIRLLHKQSPFGDQVIRAVAPMFKNHLELMYAESVDHAYEWEFQPGMLILMHLVSPLISIGVAAACWITAAFWVFTSIMGNPDGTEKRDDGADAVLAVRNWWESCLLKSTRLRVRQSMRSIV